MRHLDTAPGAGAGLASAQDEAERWIGGLEVRLPDLDAERVGVGDLVKGLGSAPARAIVERHLHRRVADGVALPLATFAPAWGEGADPVRVSRQFGVDVGTVLRRVAMLPDMRAGLVVCDASGTLTFRREVEGFALPRFTAPCALWPLYRALARPGQPIRALIETAGPLPRRFRVHAWRRSDWPEGQDGPEVGETTMLILPVTSAAEAAEPVGSSCHICPRPACVARREPSILREEG